MVLSQQTRNLPLQQRYSYPSENEKGDPCIKSEVGNIDLVPLTERIGWLREDVTLCRSSMNDSLKRLNDLQRSVNNPVVTTNAS